MDLGAHARIWGKTDNEHTCVAPNTNQPTRRDYVFVNQEALQLIQDFEVVHSILRVSFVAAKSRSTYLKAVKPASMSAFTDNSCKQHGPQQGDDAIRDFRTTTIAKCQNSLRSRLANHSDL